MFNTGKRIIWGLASAWVCWIFLLPATAAGKVPQPAPCQPETGPWLLADDGRPLADDRGFDVLSYDLQITLNPGPRTIKGRLDLGLVALQENLELVHLDLVQNLECLSIRHRGVEIFFEHLGDSLLVRPDSPLQPGETDTLIIVWEGQPLPHGTFRAGLMFREHDAGTREDFSDDMPIIANVSETWSAHSWWPCKDHPSDKALVSLSATVPDTLSLVSNGVFLGEESGVSGWHTFHWREQHPLPTYLVSVAASNYVSWVEDCTVSPQGAAAQNIPLGFHIFPQDVEDAESDLARSCETLDFLTGLLGPYPFTDEKYDQVEIKWGGAMEHSTATSMPTYFFTGDGRFENLVVHEMAHHWFGDSLTPAMWSDIWLNEGFARYCEALWLEHSLGREAYSEFMHIIGPGIHENYFVGDGPLADPDPILPNFLVYDKGAWLLHSLRLILGDDDFFELIFDYANAPALVHRTVRTNDFIALAEAQAGRSLSRFFDPWLNTEAVAKIYSEVKIESGRVTVDLQQLQETWLEVAVPVVLHCGGAQTRSVLQMRGRGGQFVLEVDCPVDSVVVDPEKSVLMQTAAASSPLMSVSAPRPNPSSRGGAEFDFFLLESSSVQVAVYDVRGRRVDQQETGLLEATGPASDPENTPQIWRWQPREPRSLSSGVYWLEFRTGAERVVKKITLVR